MRTLTPVALVVLVVLAGCSGLPVIGTESGRVTVTPAEVPTDEEKGTIAPGITETGVVDAQALVDAHQRELANESVTMNYSIRTVAENGTEISRTNSTIRYGANRTVTHTHSTKTDVDRTGATERQSWSNETDTYVRMKKNGTISYDHTSAMNQTVSASIQNTLSKAINISVKNRSSGEGPDQYELRGTIESDTNQGSSNYQIQLQIDARGVIHEYRQEFQYQQNGTTTRRTMEIRFETNTTPPKRPEWVDEAENETRNESTARESGVEE